MKRYEQGSIPFEIEEFLELTSDAVVSLDYNLKIVSFNPAAELLFGYTFEEVSGKPLDLLIPEEFKDIHHSHVGKFKAEAKTARQMNTRSLVTGKTKDGGRLTLGISIHKHNAASTRRLTAICQNVSIGAVISNALASSESRLARAQTIAHIGNWEWDIVSGSLRWSDEIFRIFGLQPQEFEATYEAFLDIIHPEDRQRVSDAVNEAVENDTPYSIVHRLICPNGEEKVVQELGEILRDSHGNPLRMDGIVHDITKEWKIKEALLQATGEARKADEAKSRFLASMSHELRTPLNAVLGFAQVLKDDTTHPLSPDQVDRVGYIIDGGRHLLKLVNRTLDLARIEAGQMELLLDEVHANEVVEDCAAMLTPQARLQGVKIIDEFSTGPSAYLHTDQLRCNQILVNLLSNAIKYNHKSGTVTIRGHETNDGYLHLSVTDTGIGIPEKDYEHLFVMFHRIEMTDRPAVEGTGIGLAASKALVESLSGRIGFESEVGVGSTFWIELPLLSEEAGKL